MISIFNLEMNRNLHDIKNTPGAYNHLASHSKNKQQHLLTRRIYLNELSSKPHLDKPQKDENYRKYHSSSRNHTKEFNLNLSKNKYQNLNS